MQHTRFRTRRLLAQAAALSLAVVALAGCSPQAGSSAGTIVYGIAGDPVLDPQATTDGLTSTFSEFAYDTLIGPGEDGAFVSQLAESWEQDGNDWIFTIRDGITCSDGTPFTAADVVKNIDYINNADNASPFLGTYLPTGITPTADEASRTVRLGFDAPSPFLLDRLVMVPMVCAAAVDDRTLLSGATLGTGPYVLTSSASGDNYTFEKRDGYAWGPDGASTDVKEMPDTLVLRVVASDSTLTNLLLAGEVNIASPSAAEAERLQGDGLFSDGYDTPYGQMLFNQGEGRITKDFAVREALSLALNFDEIREAYGPGSVAPRSFTPACISDSTTDSLPGYDPDKAAELLDEAGWVVGADGVREKNGQPLQISLLYITDVIPGSANAAEIANEAWSDLGVKVVLDGKPIAQAQPALFQTGAWDVVWTALGVPAPSILVGTFSGPGAPEGPNFAHIANEKYNALVKQALAEPVDADGCQYWMDAEAALVENADIIPFSALPYTTFGNGVKFTIAAQTVSATSLRVTD